MYEVAIAATQSIEVTQASLHTGVSQRAIPLRQGATTPAGMILTVLLVVVINIITYVVKKLRERR